MTFNDSRHRPAAGRTAASRTEAEVHVHDLVGIGFGPSNLAVAIALKGAAERALSVHFMEKQSRFVWHGGMLLPGSDMQISFLKDLALPRDPSSPFTFLAYLHEKGRLMSFINQKTFFPSRVEFNDYLGWAAGKFDACVSYGQEVVALEPERTAGGVDVVRVHARGADGRISIRRARNVALATGGTPKVPELFSGLKADCRVFHSSAYLNRIDTLALADRSAPHIAVIGAGQSAAEIFLDLTERFPQGRVDMVVRGHALRPSDDSPFVNEIFHPEYTDYVFRQGEPQRRALIAEFKSTNYSVVDGDLIARIYDLLYQQRVLGDERHRVRRLTAVRRAQAAEDGIRLDLAVGAEAEAQSDTYDAVVLATGYARDAGRSLLSGLEPYVTIGSVGRDYRLATVPEFRPAIFIQGTNEATHGLSDTLLSVLAMRGREIADALLAASDGAARPAPLRPASGM